MKSLIINLTAELNNLENEFLILLQDQDPEAKNPELVEDQAIKCVASIRSRLTSIMLSFSEILALSQDKEDVELANEVIFSAKELAITAVSTLFLSLILRISLKSNCNLTASRVLLSKLSEDTAEHTSVQKTIQSLLEKIMELDG